MDFSNLLKRREEEQSLLKNTPARVSFVNPPKVNDVPPLSLPVQQVTVEVPQKKFLPSVPIIEEYMQLITIKRYPDGRVYTEAKMWEKGTRNIVPKRKPKVTGKKITVNKAKKKDLFDVGDGK